MQEGRGGRQREWDIGTVEYEQILLENASRERKDRRHADREKIEKTQNRRVLTWEKFPEKETFEFELSLADIWKIIS